MTRIWKACFSVLALGLSFSTAAAPGETAFTVKRHALPWHVWKYDPLYHQRYTWPEFKKEVAQLNNLPNTERAFRHLKRGTELNLPSLLGQSASAAEIKKAKDDQRMFDQLEFNAVKQSWEAEKKRLQDALNRSYSSIYRSFWFWIWVAGALLLGAGLSYAAAIYFVGNAPSEEKAAKVAALEAKLAERDSEISELRSEKQQLLRESESRDYFIGKYAEPYELPPDIGSFKGKHNRIYLMRREPLEGDPALLVWNGQQYTPVKRANLNKFFNEHKRHREVLEFYNIHEGEPMTRRTGTNG